MSVLFAWMSTRVLILSLYRVAIGTAVLVGRITLRYLMAFYHLIPSLPIHID